MEKKFVVLALICLVLGLFIACAGCTGYPPGGTPTATPTVTPMPTTLVTTQPTATVTPTLTVTPQPCSPPPPGIVAWYPLDEPNGASSVNDIAGNNDQGTPQPGPSLGSPTGPNAVTGQVNGALFFASPFVQVQPSSEINFGTSDISIDAWVKPVQVGPTLIQPIVDKLDLPSTALTGTGYALYIQGQQLHFVLGDGGQLATYSSTNSPPIPFNSWTLVTVTVARPSTVTLYINGIPSTLQTPVPQLPGGSVTNSVPLAIGHNRLPGGLGEIAIDELELFNRTLSPSEIQAIYNAGPAGKCRPGKAEICVLKFDDKNGNGLQDQGEPGLPNWTVEIRDASGNVIATLTTGSSGSFCTGVPAPATYTVSEVPQPGWTQTFPSTPGTHTVTVASGQLVNLNFGNTGRCDLAIRKSISPNPVQSGQQVTITITVTNVGTGSCGPGPFPGTVVQDPQPAGLTFVAPPVANQPGWQCSLGIPTGDASCANPNPLPPGYSVTFTTNATVTAPLGSSIQNCATVKNQNDNTTANNQSCVTLNVKPCAQQPADMTAWWPLNETTGTTSADIAGIPNNGVWVNSPAPVGGEVGGALSFNGVNQYVQVPNNAELNVGTSDLSIDAWMRTSNTSFVRAIVDKRTSSPIQGYHLYLYNGNLGLQLADGVGTTTFTNYDSQLFVADGQWHHVAVSVTRNSPTGIVFFKDGVAYPTTYDPTVRSGSLDNSGVFRVGSRSYDTNAVFNGSIDEVEIFRHALTQQEIQAIYNAGPAGKCR